MSNGVQERQTDSFPRLHREQVLQLTDGLSDEAAVDRPDPGTNSISWLLRHLTWGQADHAGVEDQMRPTWRDRFRLPFNDFATGYGQWAEDTGKVRVDGELLASCQAVIEEYVQRVEDTELLRIVDTRGSHH